MASAYVKVYCATDDGKVLVRTYGGNSNEVRRMKKVYDEMTREVFCEMHPWFKDKCGGEFNITTLYHRK